MESKGKKLKWGWRTSFLWWQFHLACLLRNEWIYPDFQYSLSAFTRISIIWHSLGKSGRPLASQNFYINRFFSSIYRHSNRCVSPMRGWPCSLARTTKADLGPARRARAPRFEKCFELNFDCITCICVDFSQPAMFTICILFTSLLQKLRVCVRGIKTNPRPKNSTAPGPRPPVLKFLNPPLYYVLKYFLPTLVIPNAQLVKHYTCT